MSEKVSVIITTCNGSKKLIRAIGSVLNQTYKELEILVVDDNGKGTPKQVETEKILNDYITGGLIKYIVHDVNRNGSVARNTGVRNAKGTYIAFLDDDDFFFPERIQELIDAADEQQADMVYSDVLFVRNDNMVDIMSARAEGFSYKDLLINQSLLGTGSNIFVRRNIYDAINGFDETFFRYQDVEFMIRALKIGKIVGINHLLVAKDVTDSRFYPKFDRFLLAQKMLLTRFKDDLDCLDRKKRREAIYSKRTELYYSACMSENKANMYDAFNLLKNDIPDMSSGEVVKVKIKGLYLRKVYPAISYLRKKRQIVKSEKLTQNCSEEFLKNFNDLMKFAR